MNTDVGQIDSHIPYTQDDIHQPWETCHVLRRNCTGGYFLLESPVVPVVCHNQLVFAGPRLVNSIGL